VPQRSLIRLDLLPFERSDMNGLYLAIPPAGPEKPGGFRTGKPTVAGQALLRQNNTDDTPMKALLSVVIDCGSEVFKIAAGAAVVSSKFGVRAAVRASYIGEHLAAPPLRESG
jgi:hypothetical protein